jgi:hypothetical protein
VVDNVSTYFLLVFALLFIPIVDHFSKVSTKARIELYSDKVSSYKHDTEILFSTMKVELHNLKEVKPSLDTSLNQSGYFMFTFEPDKNIIIASSSNKTTLNYGVTNDDIKVIKGYLLKVVLIRNKYFNKEEVPISFLIDAKNMSQNGYIENIRIFCEEDVNNTVSCRNQ